MKDMVSVIRYVRPYGFEFSKYGEHDNMYGITVVYTIHYPTQSVCAQWSICNNDNFSKKFGVQMARESKNSICFSLDKVKEEGSLTEALYLTLVDFLEEPWYPIDFEDALNLFLKASRKLKQL